MTVVLGIDTSCDDTGIGIVKNGQVLANVVASQTALHAPYGGVMPEQASREHLNVIEQVLEQALAEAGVTRDEVGAVAATYGPGLVGALLVGLSFGKALAWARGVPFFPVHHLEGHIASSLGAGAVKPPFLCLIASGGHTSLFEVKRWGEYQELGRSRDDAAGEAFDKVARLLGLSYPGGPALSRLAQEGDDEAFPFSVPLKGQEGYDFSFSGLKTAVSVLLQRQPDARREDVAASFERVVVQSLMEVTQRAARDKSYKTLVVAGGVAANRRLRTALEQTDLEVFFPPLTLATDNGAMIALAAEQRLLAHQSGGEHSVWTVDAVPYLPLATPARDNASS